MNSKIVEKIKKLLSLSKSDNEHEAANAAATAAALMAEHQISIAALDDTLEESFGVFPIDCDPAKKKVSWKGRIAFGVAASFGCKWYWDGSVPTMVGRESDVAAVRYTCTYLVREINRLAEQSWKDYPMNEWESARAYKTSFRTGASQRVRLRLQQARKENLAKEKSGADERRMNAIVKVEQNDEAIKKYYDDLAKAMNFKSFRTTNKVGSAIGLQAGREAGNSINLGGANKGIGSGTKNLKAQTKQLGKG
jgi:hypothetical protein